MICNDGDLTNCPDCCSCGAMSELGLRTSFSNPPPLNSATQGGKNTELGSGFTGLLIWAPQFCTQINGSVSFVLSEVERGCSRAAMKQGGLIVASPLHPSFLCIKSTPFFPHSHTAFSPIPLSLPVPLSPNLPSPSLFFFFPPLPVFSSLQRLFRFITHVALCLWCKLSGPVVKQRGQWFSGASDASFLNKMTPTLADLTWGQTQEKETGRSCWSAFTTWQRWNVWPHHCLHDNHVGVQVCVNVCVCVCACVCVFRLCPYLC